MMIQVEHRHLRSALEFVVLIAAEGQKRRPPLDVPKELKPFLSTPRLSVVALGRVRRIVEENATFRSAIAAGALPEMVDEVGRLWLTGAQGWEERAQNLVDDAAAEEESHDLRRALKRSEKRRAAAEQGAARVQSELLVREQIIVTQGVELDDLRADLAKTIESLDEVRTDLVDTRNELRHASDRVAAVTQRAESERRRATSVPSADTKPPAAAEASRRDVDEVVAARRRAAAAHRRLEDAASAARDFADELARIATGPESDDPAVGADTVAPRRSVRSPVPLPGGVISTSAAAAEHLMRAGAVILVDGYNVAKLGWPGHSLEAQRQALVARTENLARRHDADITIVFDGSSVIGAHAGGRRDVRVVFSPEGVTADDVIRQELGAVALDRGVVVVTNDREIIDDVRRAGANAVPSNAFIATL